MVSLFFYLSLSLSLSTQRNLQIFVVFGMSKLSFFAVQQYFMVDGQPIVMPGIER